MIVMTKQLEKLLDSLKQFSPETFYHSIKTKQVTYKLLSETIRRGMVEYSQDEIDAICKGALFHDIGKLYVGNLILTKESKLSDEEKKQMNKHTTIGRDTIIELLNDDEKEIVSNICMYHHERIDGTGYYGKTDIPMYIQIVSICDAYAALSTDRVYRDGLPDDVSLEIIRTGKCGRFDEKLYEALADIVKKYVQI